MPPLTEPLAGSSGSVDASARTRTSSAPALLLVRMGRSLVAYFRVGRDARAAAASMNKRAGTRSSCVFAAHKSDRPLVGVALLPREAGADAAAAAQKLGELLSAEVAPLHWPPATSGLRAQR